METTSTKKSLNLNDAIALLKNLAIFIFPIIVTNIVPIQNWIISTIHINPEVIAIVLSSIIKLIELRLRDNK